MVKYILNINIPTKIFTIHRADCPYIRRIKETKFKGIGGLKLHGGWLEFNSLSEIEEYFRSNFDTKKYVLRFCLRCMKEEAGKNYFSAMII